jgi:predicted porin
MKKSLLALAVLSAFAGAASAQSSVTLSGSVDAGLRRVGVVSGTAVASDWRVAGSQSGYNNFTLSGIEDLGGGSRAFFSLNHRFTLNNGVDNGFTNGGGVGGSEPFWRQTWVGLGGGFGDVRIGRMLMPLQDMNGGFDPFATGTVGSTHTGGIDATIRSNNSLYYRSPSLGGLSVHLAAAAGEGQVQNEIGGSTGAYNARTTLLNSQRPVGLNVRYAAGPVNVGVAYDKNTADMKTTGIYGSFALASGIKFMGQFEKGDNYTAAGATGVAEKIKAFSLGLTAPLGPVVLRTGFLKIKSDFANRDASKFGLGADYNLSKRTNLYTTIGKLSGNRFANPKLTTANTTASLATAALDSDARKKLAFDFGVTHRF